MQPVAPERIFKIYPVCLRLLGDKAGGPGTEVFSELDFSENFPQLLSSLIEKHGLPPFLPELARLELASHQVGEAGDDIPGEVSSHQMNPTLQIVQLGWCNLSRLLAEDDVSVGLTLPEPGGEVVLLWRRFGSDEISRKVADDEDLLVLKMIMEGLAAEQVAEAGNLPVGAVDLALYRAVDRGLVLSPPSLLRRGESFFAGDCRADRDTFTSVEAFSLQWHLTQACDLHCRHCYDRSSRKSLPLDKALAVLDDLRSFCLAKHVRGHVSFSGGNPLLYPEFTELYRAAVDRGLGVAILGNPTSREVLQELIDIEPPSFYQVSLEGLPEHNDYIRGEGHFERILAFLELLKDLDIYSMVMLTLTRANMEQVIPLTELLRDKVDSFTFNRLAMVGEGANLLSVDPGNFRGFLEEFLLAAKENSSLRLKENLFNIIRHDRGRELFRGCAGFGCGAAFSFITLLPDGEVHACRKFPSPVGNILEQSLGEIYDSAAAERYRQGCEECRGCAIRPACGGCLAVGHGLGRDIFTERDPYCFMKN
ncbi:MAG: thio(seleno)oxazole modification radical SAM maturase SbtM [Thermodesulfobacteriota bacterium]